MEERSRKASRGVERARRIKRYLETTYTAAARGNTGQIAGRPPVAFVTRTSRPPPALTALRVQIDLPDPVRLRRLSRAVEVRVAGDGWRREKGVCMYV